MPLFAWAMLVTAFMILFAFTPLMVGSLLLELDRSFGTKFFDPDAGGSSLLWQHLFWIFGHPEVYIQFLPAAGRGVDDPAGVRPAANRRLHLGRGGLRRHRLHVVRAVGPPHVRRRAAAGRRSASSPPPAWPSPSRPASRSSPGWPRSGSAGRCGRRRSCSSSASSSSFVIGGITGVMVAVGAVRPAGPRLLLRRRPPALRADRRRRLPDLRRRLLLAPQVHRASCSTSDSASGTSG